MSRALALALGGGCALASAMGIGRFAYTPLLPAMQRDLNLDVAAAGYIASANFAGYLIGALLAIRVSRHQRNAWFYAALATSVLTTLVLSMLQDATAIGLIRGLSGIASAFAMIHGSAIVLDALAHEGRPALFSFLYAGVGMGIALTAALTEVMSRLHASASEQWLLLGAVAAALALPALIVRDRPHEQAHGTATAPPPGAVNATAAARPPAPSLVAAASRWLTLAYAGLGFGYVITATFVVLIVRARPEWQAWEMSVWLIVGLAGAPSNYLWLRVSNRFDTYRAMTAAYLLEAAGVLAVVAGAGLGWVFLGAALLGGTFMGITAMGLTTARLLARGESGPAVARMTAAFGAGQIAGPALAGWIAARTGNFDLPSWIAAATLVASAAMIVRARALVTRASAGGYTA